VKPASPAPQRAGKRAPTRAARGRKVTAGRRAPPAPKPKRKGVEIVDLEADPACEDPPKAVAGLEVAGALKLNIKEPSLKTFFFKLDRKEVLRKKGEKYFI